MNQSCITGLTKKEESQKKSTLESDFYKKWGYGIPDTLIKENINGKHYYKVIHYNSYIKNNFDKKDYLEIIEQNENVSDIVPKIKSLKILKEKEISKNTISIPTIDPLEIQIKKLELMEKKLQEENVQIKLNLEENIIKTITLIEKNPSIKIENQAIKKEIAAYKKISSLEAKKPNNNNNNINSQKQNLPRKNPNTNHIRQRLDSLRFLYKEFSKKYGVSIQSQMQLKREFAQFCKNNDRCCLSGRINRYCTWAYCCENNELIIDTDDCESHSSSSDFFDDESSQESSVD